MVLFDPRIRTERSITMSNIENSAEHRVLATDVAYQQEIEEGHRLAALIPTTAERRGAPIVVPEPILSDAEKLDYLYTVARKVAALVDSVSPAQIEQVKKIQRNPLLSKLFSGIIPGND